MIERLRRLFGPVPHENRGTLTFLDRGAVLGVPTDTTRSTAATARDDLARYMANGTRGVLVLPFPVDVVDKRK